MEKNDFKKSKSVLPPINLKRINYLKDLGLVPQNRIQLANSLAQYLCLLTVVIFVLPSMAELYYLLWQTLDNQLNCIVSCSIIYPVIETLKKDIKPLGGK